MGRCNASTRRGVVSGPDRQFPARRREKRLGVGGINIEKASRPKVWAGSSQVAVPAVPDGCSGNAAHNKALELTARKPPGIVARARATESGQINNGAAAQLYVIWLGALQK